MTKFKTILFLNSTVGMICFIDGVILLIWGGVVVGYFVYKEIGNDSADSILDYGVKHWINFFNLIIAEVSKETMVVIGKHCCIMDSDHL